MDENQVRQIVREELAQISANDNAHAPVIKMPPPEEHRSEILAALADMPYGWIKKLEMAAIISEYFYPYIQDSGKLPELLDAITKPAEILF